MDFPRINSLILLTAAMNLIQKLDSALIELCSIKTKNQKAVKVSKDIEVAVALEPMDVETVIVSDTTLVAVSTNPGPSTNINAEANVPETVTRGADVSEQVYVEIPNGERKKLRKKWRQIHPAPEKIT